MNTPHSISSVFPTAYVTVYPRAGVSLPRVSCIAPMAAVVVLAPAQQPRAIAGWNLNNFEATNMPNINGKDVAIIPAANSDKPASLNPSINPGPADAHGPGFENFYCVFVQKIAYLYMQV